MAIPTSLTRIGRYRGIRNGRQSYCRTLPHGQTEEYADDGLVKDLDIIVSQDNPKTEYEVLMTDLDRFLKKSKTSLKVIASSPDQLAFTGKELEKEESKIIIAG